MSWAEALSDPQGLLRCLRDVVALSAVPATRNGDDPREIAQNVAAQASLDADIVYVVLLPGADEGLNFARPRNRGADGG